MVTAQAQARLKQAEVSLANMRTDYNRAVGRLEALQEERGSVAMGISQAQSDIATWQQVQALFGKASDFARVQLKSRIEETVSAALQAVFEDNSEFRIHMRTLGGAPAAEWQLVSSKGEAGTRVISDTEDGDGGAASDVVSLALRATLLELSRPKADGPVLLDEAGKHVSKEYSANVAQFLKHFARKTGRQVCLITHSEDLASVADISYRVDIIDGVSEVTLL